MKKNHVQEEKPDLTCITGIAVITLLNKIGDGSITTVSTA